ncbi:hypothetical protein ACEZ3G_13100 [Maribacter algicola]|uniref:Uncharacterized protein n=1 Tax=Meishania litoralis TaxID=3434685 RepID=A0ACC7LKU8_9FLAO
MKISNLAISAFFVMITLAGSLKITGTIGYYALFTEDFVERFCENKARPELNCDGKCALSQMLMQKAEDERMPINLDWLKNETVLFVTAFFSVLFLQLNTSDPNFLQYRNLYDFNFIDRVTHPPRL